MLKLSSFVQDYLNETKKQVIQEGDYVEIIPVRGKKKKLKLNRKKYNISLDSSVQSIEVSHHEIRVPGGKDQDLRMTLNLYQGSPYNAYNVISEQEKFIVLNGSAHHFSFLKNGDVINLGFNQVRFVKFKGETEFSLDTIIDDRYIKSDFSILIQGETGTGKTILAKKIHNASNLRGRFVHLNLSAFSKGLIESELFGHKKGAFTGANYDKKGAIQEADNGTLFLDEIDSISLELQTKLLLFLDSGEYRAVGGEARKAKVRLIYSSGQNLKSLVAEKKVRLDFYFRLMNGRVINLPSLRECRQKCRNVIFEILDNSGFSINPNLLNWYLSCPWPGNIRQLRSHLEMKIYSNKTKYLTFDKTDIVLKDERFPTLSVFKNEDVIKLSDLKKNYIQHMLLANNGNLKLTSQQIGISENTIRRSAFL